MFCPMFRFSIALTLVALFAAPVPLAAQTAPQTAPAPAQAQAPSDRATFPPQLRDLFEHMRLYEILEIMSVEGVQAAPDLEADLFPGQGGSAWMATAAQLYSVDKMISRFEAAIPIAALSPEVATPLIAFFDSDLGARIAEGEVAARRAFLDPDVKDAASTLAQERAAAGDPRLELLTEFIAANDLVDRNVSGALNSNFAFYQGLSDAGAFGEEIPETMMLAEIWSQEPQIRSDTLDWLFSYQLLAYQGLSDAELHSYIALSQSPAGQALNRALFAAFDVVFEQVSRDLGQAAARFLSGQDL